MKVCNDCGDWCDFCFSQRDRVVSVLAVRDPESRLADQAKGVPIYTVV